MPLHEWPHSTCPRNSSPHQATLYWDRAREAEDIPFTDEQLAAMRGGLTAEEYRWRLIKKGRCCHSSQWVAVASEAHQETKKRDRSPTQCFAGWTCREDAVRFPKRRPPKRAPVRRGCHEGKATPDLTLQAQVLMARWTMPRNLSILSVLPESPKTECHAEMLHLRAALEGDRQQGHPINWVFELQLLDGSRRESVAKADHTRPSFTSSSANWTSPPEEKSLGLRRGLQWGSSRSRSSRNGYKATAVGFALPPGSRSNA